MKKLLGKTNKYILYIILIATIFLIYLFTRFPIYFNKDIFIFIILAAVAESLPITSVNQGGITVGFAIILPVMIFFEPAISVLVVGLGEILAVSKWGNKVHHVFNTPIYKTIFNLSMYIISAGIAGLAYEGLGGSFGSFSLSLSLIPALIAAFIYIVTNGLIITRLLSYLNNIAFMEIWISNVRWALPNFLAIGSLGIIIALAYESFGIGAVVLLFGPLLLARFSFKLYLDMKNNYIETIQALSTAMEEKDPYTQGHAQRVSELAILLGEEIKLNSRELEQLRYAAILHDVGKIGIPEAILNKPDKLNEEEYKVIKEHPTKGVKILENIDFLKYATSIMQYHHEYFDGSGYPEGKMGEDIPLSSRIITIVDAYDAMTTDRPYRKALSVEFALKEIQNKAGEQFDPRLVQAFVKIHREGRVEDK